MTLRKLLRAGPAKVNELLTRLAETSDGALKTRDRLFAELKAEVESHIDLEEQHLFPALRKKKNRRAAQLVAGGLRGNKELRTTLAGLDALPKNDETFLAKLGDLRESFRQYARAETNALLPAVQKVLSEDQVQGITERMETSVAEVEQAKQEEARKARSLARQHREHAAQGEAAEHGRRARVARAREAASRTKEAIVQTAEAASDMLGEITQSVTEGAVKASAATRTTGFPFWDMWLGLSVLQPGRSVVNGSAQPEGTNEAGRQVIPLHEEVLTVGTRKVSSGTTRIHRYVVETPVEKQVTLVRERVVVERRKPVTDHVTGEMLTELTVEVTETDEIPVIGRSVRLREEVVVNVERTERVETVRETLRQDRVRIVHPRAKRLGDQSPVPAGA